MTEEDRRPEEIDGALGGIPFKGTLSQGGDLEIDPDVFVQAIERQLFFHRLTSRICGLGFMSEADKKIEQGMIETLAKFRADADADADADAGAA